MRVSKLHVYTSATKERMRCLKLLSVSEVTIVVKDCSGTLLAPV